MHLIFLKQKLWFGKALSDASSAIVLALDPNTSDCVPMDAVDVFARLLRQVDDSKVLICCPALMHRQQFTHRNTQILTKAPELQPFPWSRLHEGFQMLLRERSVCLD